MSVYLPNLDIDFIFLYFVWKQPSENRTHFSTSKPVCRQVEMSVVQKTRTKARVNQYELLDTILLHFQSLH